MKFRFLAYLSCVLLVLSCTNNKEPDDDTKTVLTVADVSITEADFKEYYARHLIRTGKNDTREERYGYLNKMADQLIISNEAISKGVLKDDAAQAFMEIQEKKAYRDFYFLDSMEENHIELSDEEIRQSYQRSKSRIYVRQLFFRDMDIAQFYYNRLEDGEDFVDLANELFQTDSYDSTAGWLGEIRYFSVDDAFAEVAFATPVNSYSRPVQSKWGIHIVKVEQRVNNALISEDQFQLGLKGVKSQLRLRKQRLEGNAFVRAQMEQTNPQLNESILKNVHARIETMFKGRQSQLKKDESPDKIRFTSVDSEELLEPFSPTDIMATYQVDGKTYSLTVAEFASWLPDLLTTELLYRFGASVGRVLRNEAFYRKGINAGYSSDSRVQHDLDVRKHMYASEKYLHQLIYAERDNGNIDEEAFQEFLQSKSKTEWTFNFFIKQYTIVDEAQKDKKRLSGVTNDVLLKQGFSQKLNVVSPKNIQFRILRDAPLNTLSLGLDSENNIYLVKVLTREEETILPQMDEYRPMFETYETVNNYVRALKNEAAVEVDSARFEAMMVW